jgi:hypothetical protein
MSCSGSHLGITINIKNTKFVKDLPMIDAQFRFNQCNSFREEYISEKCIKKTPIIFSLRTSSDSTGLCLVVPLTNMWKSISHENV